jgi:hypothetical protein
MKLTLSPVIYLPPPPLTGTTFSYQNVNVDPKLQKSVTDWYYDNLFEWMEDDYIFKPLKKEIKYLQSKDGYRLVYKVLKHLVKKNDTNWYDLRSDGFTKEYLATKLRSVLHL